MNPLHERFAALRRRLRLVVTFRGMCWVLALLSAIAVAIGWIDWHVHLPSLIRALVTVSTLVAGVYLARRYLISPLAAPADDLTLALRVEKHYPVLNDSLASAVQFLQEPSDSERTGSPTLRQIAVKRALHRAKAYDFLPVIDTRGTRSAGLSLLVAGGLAIVVAAIYPQLAWTGFLRLAHPFGGYDWPRQTRLDVEAKQRVGRGESYEIKVKMAGVLPDRAIIDFRFEGAPSVEQAYEIVHQSGSDQGAFVAHLDGTRVQRNFRFQVRANDAESRWRDVEVLPPPQLTLLNGRQSPQIALIPPAYTDQPSQQLPDGAASIETIAGTQVLVRAATDRPLSRAWLEYPAECQVGLSAAALVAPLGVSLPGGLLHPAAFAAESWTRIPARLDPTGKILALAFVARVSGTFALHLEDEMGLTSTRLLELRSVPDPAPVVNLLRPSRSQDSFDILPGAEITVQYLVDDPIFAIRSIYVDYQIRRFRSEAVEPGRFNLYDHEQWGVALPQLLNGVAPAARLRPQHLEGTRRWPLAGLKLQEGDVLAFEVCAEDFDDVTTLKPPGKSHQVELRVVTKNALEIALNEAQAQIQQGLLQVQKQQQEAMQKILPAETRARTSGERLKPEELDQLMQAEQLQQQIRARVGNRQEGLRAESARVLQALKDNKVPRSGAQDRMEAVTNELDRLAQQDLEQIEPRLTEARKQNELGAPSQTPEERARNPLTEARKNQEEVARTVDDLLKLMEPWSTTREVKGEARSLLQDQQRLREETSKLGTQLPPGEDRANLNPNQQVELERTAEQQSKLAERTGRLLDKLDRLEKDRQAKDPESAKALQEAAQRGKNADAAGKMQEAVRDVRDNRLSQAERNQEASQKALEDMVKALEDRREEELERLSKKMQDAEQKLDDIRGRQEQLGRQSRDAEQNPDAKAREEELKRLAREQEKLQKEAQEMVRELSRMRADRASRSLSQAGQQMQQGAQRMQQGERAQDQQAEALDRLNEAKRELADAREDVEDELARERLAKVADQIKGLKERQLPMIEESSRLHRRVLEEKQWTRELGASLTSLSDAQKGLADETMALAKEKLDDAKIFQRLLNRSAEAMQRSSERMIERLEKARKRLEETPANEEPSLDVPGETAADAETRLLQQMAARRIDQLLDAMKNDDGRRNRSGQGRQQGQQGEQGQGQQGRRGGGDEDGVALIAQLKAMRALQDDINDRTQVLAKKGADPSKLTAADKDEMRRLQVEQQELTELFNDLTAPEDEEPAKPAPPPPGSERPSSEGKEKGRGGEKEKRSKSK